MMMNHALVGGRSETRREPIERCHPLTPRAYTCDAPFYYRMLTEKERNRLACLSASALGSVLSLGTMAMAQLKLRPIQFLVIISHSYELTNTNILWQLHCYLKTRVYSQLENRRALVGRGEIFSFKFLTSSLLHAPFFSISLSPFYRDYHFLFD